MISVSEADRIIRQNIELFPVIQCDLDEAYGRILREDIYSDRDQPPFHKALLDGIAIHYASWQKGIRKFPIERIQAAGQNPLKLQNKNACIEIMTGAALPFDCDCLIPVEYITTSNNIAIVKKQINLQRMLNIRPQGSDYRKGEKLLAKKCVLLPPQIGVCASVGKNKIKVTKTLKIAIISTGDELVKVNVPIKPYQTRISNSYALQAAFQKTGHLDTVMFHLKDDKKQLFIQIRSVLNKFDVLVLSGGVSMGKFDYVPSVLKELGVRVLFHKVAQRPGKPFWFGKSKNKKLVFALPGNPVSTQVCTYRYVLPNLRRALGIKNNRQEYSLLVNDFNKPTELAYFLPVTINNTQSGKIEAQPVSISGSGDFVALAKADGFVELSDQKKNFKKGTAVPLFRWKL